MLLRLVPLQVPWSTGTECVAKYNFQTANEQDLPFCKGDVLTIIGVTRVRLDRSKAQSFCHIRDSLTTSHLMPTRIEVMVPEPAPPLKYISYLDILTL